MWGTVCDGGICVKFLSKNAGDDAKFAISCKSGQLNKDRTKCESLDVMPISSFTDNLLYQPCEHDWDCEYVYKNGSNASESIYAYRKCIIVEYTNLLGSGKKDG